MWANAFVIASVLFLHQDVYAQSQQPPAAGSLRPGAVSSQPQTCSCTREWNPVCVEPPLGSNLPKKTFPNACEAECFGLSFTEGGCPDVPSVPSEKCAYMECEPSSSPTGVCAFGESFPTQCIANCKLKDYEGLVVRPGDITRGACPDPCENNPCAEGRQCYPRPGPCVDRPCTLHKCVDPVCYTSENPCDQTDYSLVCGEGLTFTNKCYAECEGIPWVPEACPLSKRDYKWGNSVVPYPPPMGSPLDMQFKMGSISSSGGASSSSSSSSSNNGGSSGASVTTLTCQARRNRELTACGERIGCQITECANDGSYSSIQCSGSTGFCWCVDGDGNLIEGTAARGRNLNCASNAGVSSSPAVQCVAGLYFDSSSDSCKPCWKGTSSVAGSTECKKCRPGFEAPNLASPACEPCQVGFYAPIVGSKTCLACPIGMTSDPGQPYCEDTDPCSESAKDPCACGRIGGNCGWDLSTRTCISGGTTTCLDCPTLDGCSAPTPSAEEVEANPASAMWEDVPPSEVRLLVMTDRTDSSLQLQWVPPLFRHDCGTDLYLVRYRAGTIGQWKTVRHKKNSKYTTEHFTVIKDLQPDTYYAVQVYAARRNDDDTVESGPPAKLVARTLS